VGTGLSCVGAGTPAGGGTELLAISESFGWGVANLNEWVQVVGWVQPYFPYQGYGEWIQSSNVIQYRVLLDGATSSGYSLAPNLFVVGGTTAPGSAWYLQWDDYNGVSVGPDVYVLMGVSIWTERTGWFFDTVRPENVTGTASVFPGLDGYWCYYP